MINFTQNHAEIPVFAVVLYLGVIFYVPRYLKNPLPLRKVFGAWNVLLATFSILGATRCVPMLFKTLQEKGFHYTVCTDPQEWYLDGPSGFWTFLFIYSKLP